MASFSRNVSFAGLVYILPHAAHTYEYVPFFLPSVYVTLTSEVSSSSLPCMGHVAVRIRFLGGFIWRFVLASMLLRVLWRLVCC